LGLLLAKKLLHGGGKKILDWNVVLYLLNLFTIFWVLNNNELIITCFFTGHHHHHYGGHGHHGGYGRYGGHGYGG
jgi:hypothetical protein